jgi:hypothetical protein
MKSWNYSRHRMPHRLRHVTASQRLEVRLGAVLLGAAPSTHLRDISHYKSPIGILAKNGGHKSERPFSYILRYRDMRNASLNTISFMTKRSVFVWLCTSISPIEMNSAGWCSGIGRCSVQISAEIQATLRFFRDCLQSPPGKCQDSTSRGPQPLPNYHRSPYHSKLYSPDQWFPKWAVPWGALEVARCSLIYDWSDFRPGIGKLVSLHEVCPSHSEFTKSEVITKFGTLLLLSSSVGYANRCSEECFL